MNFKKIFGGILWIVATLGAVFAITQPNIIGRWSVATEIPTPETYYTIVQKWTGQYRIAIADLAKSMSGYYGLTGFVTASSLTTGYIPYWTWNKLYNSTLSYTGTNIYTPSKLWIGDSNPYYSGNMLNVSGSAMFYNPWFTQAGWFLLNVFGFRVWIYGAIIWMSTGASVYGQTDIWYWIVGESVGTGIAWFFRTPWTGTAIRTEWNVIISGNLSALNMVTGFVYPGNSTGIATTLSVANYIENLSNNLSSVITTWAYVLSWETAIIPCLSGQRQTAISGWNISFQKCVGTTWVEKWSFN